MTPAERALAGRVPPIAFVRGDATQPEGQGTKVIIHVCNDVGAWGAGFVVALSRRWRAPEELYLESPYSKRLGVIQCVKVEPDVDVVNMIAQRRFPTSEKPCALDYRALHHCLQTLAVTYESMDASIHMPRIGCGIAGGEWAKIEHLVSETLSKAGFPVTVYDLPPPSFVTHEDTRRDCSQNDDPPLPRWDERQDALRSVDSNLGG